MVKETEIIKAKNFDEEKSKFLENTPSLFGGVSGSDKSPDYCETDVEDIFNDDIFEESESKET